MQTITLPGSLTQTISHKINDLSCIWLPCILVTVGGRRANGRSWIHIVAPSHAMGGASLRPFAASPWTTNVLCCVTALLISERSHILLLARFQYSWRTGCGRAVECPILIWYY
jgi:hypothetical protein